MKTQLTITKTHRAGGIDLAWDVEFVDNRRGGIVALTITREELPYPDRPTLRGLEIVCLARLLPPIQLKPSRETKCRSEKWTRDHEAARDFARLHSADIDKLVGCLDDALAARRAEYDGNCDRREARLAACRMLEIQPRQLGRYVARIENSYSDRSTIGRFDEMAEELADEFPGAGIDRNDPDTLWELLRSPADRAPRRYDSETLALAASMVETAHNPEIEFSAWDETSSAADDSAEFVPF